MAEHAEPARKSKAAKAAAPKRPAVKRPARIDPSSSLLSARAAAGPQPIQRALAAPAPNHTGLPDGLKAGVEALSGLSMDDVRVHRHSAEPAKLGALAYAQGTDIHLGPGQEQHLPHEAWHVVQQKQGRVRPSRSISGLPINDEGALESEADNRGAAAASRSNGCNPDTPELQFRKSLNSPVRISAPIQMSRPGPDDMAKALVNPPAEEETEEEEVEEPGYSNDQGAYISSTDYDRLHMMIDGYDVTTEQDHRRGAAFNNVSTNEIGVNLANMASYVRDNRGLRIMLDFVCHPGTGDLGATLKGKSFNDILSICAQGNECNNALADALRRCLDGLSLDTDE
jgi:hypothetical protein